MDIPIISAGIKRGKSEACVSFTRKFNLENYDGPPYENIEIFASRKVECAPEDIDALEADLHQECINEIELTARAYILDASRKWKEYKKRKQAERERRSA